MARRGRRRPRSVTAEEEWEGELRRLAERDGVPVDEEKLGEVARGMAELERHVGEVAAMRLLRETFEELMRSAR